MASVTFQPSGPLRECIDIAINRDFLVENSETFVFALDSEQADEAVALGTQVSTFVVIVDEENSKLCPQHSQLTHGFIVPYSPSLDGSGEPAFL